MALLMKRRFSVNMGSIVKNDNGVQYTPYSTRPALVYFTRFTKGFPLHATPSQVEAVTHARSPIQNGVQTKGCMDMVAYMTFQLKKCPVLPIILSFVE